MHNEDGGWVSHAMLSISLYVLHDQYHIEIITGPYIKTTGTWF